MMQVPIRERLTDSLGEAMLITFCTCDECGQKYLKFAYDDDAYNNGWAYNACADCNGSIAV